MIHLLLSQSAAPKIDVPCGSGHCAIAVAHSCFPTLHDEKGYSKPQHSFSDMQTITADP